MSSNRKSIVAGVLAGTLVLTIAPARGDDTMKHPTETTTSVSTADAGILSKLVAIDQNEIKMARTAERKKLSAATLNYARMLRDQHQQNLSDTQKLAHKLTLSPRPTAEADEIHKKGTTELAQLQPLEGQEFERAFLDAMVKGHQEALDMLDQGIESAQSPDVKAHLQKTRDAVSTHLSEAKQLQGGAATSTGR
jgi:putative membrane protein